MLSKVFVQAIHITLWVANKERNAMPGYARKRKPTRDFFAEEKNTTVFLSMEFIDLS